MRAMSIYLRLDDTDQVRVNDCSNDSGDVVAVGIEQLVLYSDLAHMRQLLVDIVEQLNLLELKRLTSDV